MNAMDFETSLGVLKLLSDALSVPRTLDESLTQIATITGRLMETEQTAIMLRDEERREFIVRNCVGLNGSNIRVGHPLNVPDRLKNILWRIGSLHQINWVESGIEDIGFPILVVPLRIRGARVGLLATGKCRAGAPGYDPIRRKLFSLIASFAALLIENAKAYDYVKQQFAMHSQELILANRTDASGRDEAEHLMITSVSNPNKVVRLLAESFYKELARAGFSPSHIMTGATHILECITRSEPVNSCGISGKHAEG
jgi:GAF domain-containing protein